MHQGSKKVQERKESGQKKYEMRMNNKMTGE
jgi:hypothetical protein